MGALSLGATAVCSLPLGAGRFRGSAHSLRGAVLTGAGLFEAADAEGGDAAGLAEEARTALLRSLVGGAGFLVLVLVLALFSSQAARPSAAIKSARAGRERCQPLLNVFRTDINSSPPRDTLIPALQEDSQEDSCREAPERTVKTQ